MINLNVRLILVLMMALILTIIPFPTAIAGFRPQWLLLLILYIQFFLPQHFRVMIVIGLGLCLDSLLSTVLGEHAFALVVASWLAVGRRRRFMLFSTLQQMALILIFCGVYLGLTCLVEASQGYNIRFEYLMETLLASVLFWPGVKWFGDKNLRVSSPYFV